ncbi:hypothetical protein E4U54_000534 [Claviceps lovelessii]|nr:hypothetical protein E4U54_000534 [Claviceps lovelessii]
MRFFGNTVAVATVLSAALSQAQYLINEQSFGHTGRFTVTDGRIPHFTLHGQPQHPEILSNKIVLTPVAPGNQRSSIWADAPLARSTWVADVEFRASGVERAGGNLNIWFAKRGKEEVGTNSVYTARKFEGLVLVVDSHGGSGGMIRGFLNDGTVDYVSQASVDKLAFGHCDYYYRNLGRPSQIKLRQTPSNFRVEVDGQLCFETDKVSLPAGYHFGITAATPDNPDSFEIFKLVVMSDSTVSSENNHGHQQQQQQQQQPPHSQGGKSSSSGFTESIPDQPAENFKSSVEQFQDLHNRLQVLSHQVLVVYETVVKRDHSFEDFRDELKKEIESLRHDLGALTQLNDMQIRMRGIEGEMRSIHKEIGSALSSHHQNIHQNLLSHHNFLAQTLSDSVPGHGKLMFFFVATQIILIACYVMYKRHRATSPKKYL